MKHGAAAAMAAVSVPWNAFVAAFLYYVLLTALALSGLSPSLAVVATAYLAPVVAYVVILAARTGRALVHASGPATPQVARGH